MSSKKKYKYLFFGWIIIFSLGLVRKPFQNDTFYTIKIGEWIINHGIDMLDHFSFHGLPYTYPHWLYDCFIYVIYKAFGYTGIYISSILLFILLLAVVFRLNIRTCKNFLMGAFISAICALSISGFVTARAQLVSFILFSLEIYFIETFLEKGKKRSLIGLLLISFLLCNVHVAVWPFYFVLYLPYLAEYLIAWIGNKVKFKKENKFINFFKEKFILEKNENVRYLFIIMIVSLFTGLLTPIGDTPYTYFIKTMMGNSQKYILEHQSLTWANSPFPIIITAEALFLAIYNKAKLRDIFMISGLLLMNIISVRHMAFLALIGTVCFGRIFAMFLDNYGPNINMRINAFFKRKSVIIGFYILAIIFSGIMLNSNLKKEFINHEIYPIEAVKFIKENTDISKIRIFNEYNYGSYLVLNDIPVFIDSRADLYTKPFNHLERDIFDEYEITANHYQQYFEDYKITHVLLNKNNNQLHYMLKNDTNYEVLYEDEYFIFYKKLGMPDYIITYETDAHFTVKY